MEKKSNLEDWINLFLGAWIFIVPWAVGHNLTGLDSSAAMWNFWIVGIVIFGSSSLALQDIKPWEEWTNLLAGVWLVLSPWIFGYAFETGLLWNSIVVGLSVSFVSSLALPIAMKRKAQAQ
jgi:hypothetical protein